MFCTCSRKNTGFLNFYLYEKVGVDALEVLYGDNVFQAYLDGGEGYYLKRRFREANMRRIRRMQLVMQP
jgi:hypothetical protein